MEIIINLFVFFFLISLLEIMLLVTIMRGE